ncbi:MAG: hypothetical protein Kow0032_07100 [Methyloligellaceae bacterium]
MLHPPLAEEILPAGASGPLYITFRADVKRQAVAIFRTMCAAAFPRGARLPATANARERAPGAERPPRPVPVLYL